MVAGVRRLLLGATAAGPRSVSIANPIAPGEFAASINLSNEQRRIHRSLSGRVAPVTPVSSVFDASALIAFLRDDPGAGVVEVA